MSANTGKVDRLRLVEQITSLALQAAEYTAAGQRDLPMAQRLVDALQLFKERRLGDVLNFQLSDKKQAPLSKGFHFRREVFKAKIARFGEIDMEQEFHKSLLTRTRNRIETTPLRTLVTHSERELRRRGVGDVSMADLQRAFAERGLTVDMTVEEVEYCFGPNLVRLVVRLTKENSGYDLPDRKVIVRSEDGSMKTEVTSFLNGAFFSLPPGRYEVLLDGLVEGKVHLQHNPVEIHIKAWK